MTEEQLFLAALELTNPVDRTAYLEAACGGDAELRRQVEELLTSHFKSGEFLNENTDPQSGAVSPSSIHNSHEVAQASLAEQRADQVTKSDEDFADIHFLEPSTYPDSFGRIGHYEVLEVLGKGGFGIVFRAFDVVLHRVVALKVLSPALATSSPARKRFLREAQSSAQIRHENVVQVYAVGEQPLPYLVMEFIPGETLQQRLDRTGPLEVLEVVRIGAQIAEGLAAAHATGLIHRDIKPANLLIEAGPQGQVKITDFGLARAADDASMTQSGVLAGTPIYMAPEQAKGETLDHRTDLFSLGSVLYIAAAGRPPFRAATTYAVLKRVVEDDPRPVREVIPEIPQWLSDIIKRLHAKKPEDRFQSARDVAEVLAACESQQKTNGEIKNFAPIPNSRLGKPRIQWWKWVAVAALLIPGLVLATTNFAGMTSAPPNRQLPPDSPPKQVDLDHTNSLGMKFKLIPAGKFTMGSSKEEVDHFVGMVEDEVYKYMLQSEFPEHEVEITKPFYLGATEVTLGEFRHFIEANPDYKMPDDRWKNPDFPQTDKHPVVWVAWQNAVDFCHWLSKKEGRKYRLPTEAEWEYSCRAGTSGTRYSFGNDDTQLKDYAVYEHLLGSGTRPVGERLPNAWGLYDMHGNVWEWCQDRFEATYYKDSPLKDPAGPSNDNQIVQRGGSWGYNSFVCRAAFRSFSPPVRGSHQRGFRVVLVPNP